jgi:hypothetical protein
MLRTSSVVLAAFVVASMFLLAGCGSEEPPARTAASAADSERAALPDRFVSGRAATTAATVKAAVVSRSPALADDEAEAANRPPTSAGVRQLTDGAIEGDRRVVDVSRVTDQLLDLLALAETTDGDLEGARFDDELSAWLDEHSDAGRDGPAARFMFGLFVRMQNPADVDLSLERHKEVSGHRGRCMTGHGFSLDTLTYEHEAYLELADGLGMSETRALEVLGECTDYGQQQFRSDVVGFYGRHRQIILEAAWAYITANRGQIPATIEFVE